MITLCCVANELIQCFIFCWGGDSMITLCCVANELIQCFNYATITQLINNMLSCVAGTRQRR